MRSSGSYLGDVTMEVPLAWQDPLPLTHFSAMEGDPDDVPPSPTLDPVTPPALAVGSFFQRGFLDCAQEALRFLTEEEGMSQDNPVVTGLRRHLAHATPHLTPPTTSPCLTSSVSQRARFAPYTVPSHRHQTPGYPRRELGKHSASIVLPEQSSMLHRCTTTTTPSMERLDRVLTTSDLISTDDLQGVLKCLGPGQPHSLQNLSVSHSSLTLSSPLVQSSSVKVGVCHGEKKNDDWQRNRNSLDDSGISEVGTELDDEVDGLHTSVSESVCDVDTPTSADSVFVSVLDSGDHAVTLSGDRNSEGDSVGRCSTPNRFSFENLPTDSFISPPVNSYSSAAPSNSTPTTDTPVNSNPSSQLALLSSLSSGTHRLTSPASMDDGAATASRIQSLASQILLLLQEEADAQDYSDDENDDDEDDHSSDLGESEVEEDLWDLEAEP